MGRRLRTTDIHSIPIWEIVARLKPMAKGSAVSSMWSRQRCHKHRFVSQMMEEGSAVREGGASLRCDSVMLFASVILHG
jgi:hypothetical protein